MFECESFYPSPSGVSTTILASHSSGSVEPKLNLAIVIGRRRYADARAVSGLGEFYVLAKVPRNNSVS